MPLTPQDFVSKWKRADARERQSVQEHFIDLCALVGHESPMQSDPTGTRFALEMGAASQRRNGLGRCRQNRLFRVGVQSQRYGSG